MKPLIKWSGGKAREIEMFKPYYPKDFEVYIEPFVGGGAVFFDLNFNGKNVINDIHPELINFYKQISLGKSQEIYDLMAKYPNDEKVYYRVRDEFIPSNDIERAFVFYYLRKTCFRGMLRYNKQGKFNIPFGRYKTYKYDSILEKEYQSLLSKTEILSIDFEEIFNKYNSSSNFFFIDPPYDSEFTDYGYCKFERDKQERLSQLFKETENKVMIVIGKTDFIVSLYKNYIRAEYQKNYAFKIHSGRVGNEINNKHLVITNY